MSGKARKLWTSPFVQQAVRATAKWTPLAFIGVILVLLCFGVADIRALAAKSSADSTLTAAELKDRIDGLRWILELILAASGLFTIAQGIAAGFSAKSFSDQAEGMLAEVKSRFSVLQLLENRRNAGNANLTNLENTLAASSSVNSPDEGFNWQRRFYGKMPLRIRQELLSAEQIFPYEVVGEDEPSDVFARNLRRLAQFYWAKFIYERERGLGYLQDLGRAEYLLDLAILKIGSAFYLLNDMGNIFLEYYNVQLKAASSPSTGLAGDEEHSYLNRARSSFEESLAVHENQLRAYYNLAYIEADTVAAKTSAKTQEQRLRKAIDYLEKGLQYDNWEREPIRDHTCNALFNLSCYYARLVPFSKSAKQDCIRVLEKTAEYGLVSPEDVNREFNTEGGDFHLLVGDKKSAMHTTLRNLESRLSRNYR